MEEDINNVRYILYKAYIDHKVLFGFRHWKFRHWVFKMSQNQWICVLQNRSPTKRNPLKKAKLQTGRTAFAGWVTSPSLELQMDA